MRVRDIMTVPVETVEPATPAVKAAQVMKALHVHHLVVKEGAKIAGIVSARDVARAGNRPVRDLMTPHVATIDPDDTVRRAANVMRGRSIGALVVTSRHRLAGIITVSDLLDLIGRGAAGRAPVARASLHYRVPHEKHQRRAW